MASELRSLRVFRLFYVFLPDTSLLRQARFQLVVASRALSELGQDALFYGTVVAVAGDPLKASLIAVGNAAPAAAFGLLGGTVADALPRRVALGLGYAAQAGACAAVALVFGTAFIVLLLLVATVSALNQVLGPSEKAVIPLVSSRTQIATAAAILSVAGSIGSGIGGGLLSPVLMKTVGLRTLLLVCSGLLALAAARVFSLPLEREVTVTQALKRLRLQQADLSIRPAIEWLIGWPAVATMITAGVVVSVLNLTMNTLGPSYVGSALHADPADSVYVFMPGSIAAFVAVLIGAKLIDRMGERMLAASAVLVQAASLFALALIDSLSPVLAPLSPTNVVRLAGAHPSDALLAASFVSIFIGFSASLSGFAVQTYLNRRVPAVQQGRVFGLQSMLANGIAVVPLVGLGALAKVSSVKMILFWAPWVMAGIIYLLLVLISRWSGRERPRPREVLSSFWLEPQAEGEAGQARAR